MFAVGSCIGALVFGSCPAAPMAHGDVPVAADRWLRVPPAAARTTTKVFEIFCRPIVSLTLNVRHRQPYSSGSGAGGIPDRRTELGNHRRHGRQRRSARPWPALCLTPPTPQRGAMLPFIFTLASVRIGVGPDGPWPSGVVGETMDRPRFARWMAEASRGLSLSPLRVQLERTRQCGFQRQLNYCCCVRLTKTPPAFSSRFGLNQRSSTSRFSSSEELDSVDGVLA